MIKKKEKMMKPELLAPAGNLEKVKIGLMYGADAFYMGMPSFSMRSRTNNFTQDSLMEAVDLIRKNHKTLYMTMNIYPRGNKIDAFKKHLAFVRETVKPDAIIVADPGVFELIKEHYPEVVLHMSVQANVLNYRAVEFWRKQGAERIILPRELMLSEINEIHQNVPNVELEFFVHGAICMAYSGRCLLSNYMTGRDSNQGICAHSCRWKYKVYLEEEKRPGEMIPVDEDEHGTYFMNSKDMCLLPHIKDLYDSGICSFKIEGRNKSEYYLATVVKAYRKAIDEMLAGKEFDKTLIDEVESTANRGFIPGYLFGFPAKNDIRYDAGNPLQKKKFMGMVLEEKNKTDYVVDIKNKLNVGEILEVMTPDENFEVEVSAISDVDGIALTEAHGGAGNRILTFKGNKKNIPVYAMLRMKC
ncbi:MAG: U32 family peptidase C-terminal domain-containing protein [Candidatus Peregrinibacteria bacterium]|nr:U32 family peptidase C-terminal domain-containing protein [Candidatus Peregrinibacteria bacterium]